MGQTSVNTPPTGATGGTSSTAASASTHLKVGALPPDVRLYANAIGSRLTAPGLEQTTMTGTYTDNNGTVPLTLVWQNPGKVQVTLGSGATTVLSFVSAAAGAAGATSAAYQDLLETLTDDYPDAFFFNVGSAAYRFSGRAIPNGWREGDDLFGALLRSLRKDRHCAFPQYRQSEVVFLRFRHKSALSGAVSKRSRHLSASDRCSVFPTGRSLTGRKPRVRSPG